MAKINATIDNIFKKITIVFMIFFVFALMRFRKHWNMGKNMKIYVFFTLFHEHRVLAKGAWKLLLLVFVSFE